MKGRNVLCKQSLDRLLGAVEQNRISEIHKSVEALFTEMKASGFSEDLINMNINYLLFQMTHLAVEQDESVDQEEVLLYIMRNVSEEGLEKGSTMHLKRFACEYAEYLVQLRGNVSKGVLLSVEKEVREHYAENLTLKDLSRTYFVNSSYLGQIFRKKYGQSFKDYLNAYRIGQAAVQLVRTDKKISAVAEDVGYHDTDYFIRKNLSDKLLFRKAIDYISKNDSYLHGDKILEQLIPKDGKRSQVYVNGREESFDYFLEDIASAESSINIDMPGEINDDEYLLEKLINCLEQKNKENVEITIRCENDLVLPPNLQKYVKVFSCVTNPVTIIDKRVTWFGQPLSAADFISNGSSIDTRYFPCIRFEGKHTARLLKAFLEM